MQKLQCEVPNSVFTFYCDSHLYQLFPRVRSTSTERKRQYHGSAPACRAVGRCASSLPSRLSIENTFSRHDKRLPCEKPFMAHEVLTGFGYPTGDRHNLDETSEKECTVSDTGAGWTHEQPGVGHGFCDCGLLR